MAYKSLIGDLKLVRNLIQDETENPYTAAVSKGYGSSTNYVFALGILDPASATPTDTELYTQQHRSKLPLIVTVTQISNPAGRGIAGEEQFWGVLVRCFVSADSMWTFKTAKRGAEEMAAEKLNEIAYEFTTDLTIQAALAAAGLILPAEGVGDIRPIVDKERQDFAYAMDMLIMRNRVA